MGFGFCICRFNYIFKEGYFMYCVYKLHEFSRIICSKLPGKKGSKLHVSMKMDNFMKKIRKKLYLTKYVNNVPAGGIYLKDYIHDTTVPVTQFEIKRRTTNII